MSRQSVDASAEEALARMGYKSELPRNLSMLSVLGLYVSVSVPFVHPLRPAMLAQCKTARTDATLIVLSQSWLPRSA